MSRKDYETYKEGERAYQRFMDETGSQDPEMEKEIDRIISQRMAQGWNDEDIMNEIMNG